mmetsp:Transcript_47124/g.143205  ORF Transcript_47124/g.143205 Transcript_47124/m.143205 type:complete len:305 (+) Transcript_47124:712-1626(+)
MHGAQAARHVRQDFLDLGLAEPGVARPLVAPARHEVAEGALAKLHLGEELPALEPGTEVANYVHARLVVQRHGRQHEGLLDLVPPALVDALRPLHRVQAVVDAVPRPEHDREMALANPTYLREIAVETPVVGILGGYQEAQRPADAGPRRGLRRRDRRAPGDADVRRAGALGAQPRQVAEVLDRALPAQGALAAPRAGPAQGRGHGPDAGHRWQQTLVVERVLLVEVVAGRARKLEDVAPLEARPPSLGAGGAPRQLWRGEPRLVITLIFTDAPSVLLVDFDLLILRRDAMQDAREYRVQVLRC